MLLFIPLLITNALAGGGTGFSVLPEVQKPEIVCDTLSKDDRFQRVHFVMGTDKNGKALGEIQLLEMESQLIFENISAPVIAAVLLKAKTNGIALEAIAKNTHQMTLEGVPDVQARLNIKNQNLAVNPVDAFFVMSPRHLDLSLQKVEAVFTINGERVVSACNISGSAMKSLLKPNLTIQDLLK